MALTPITLTNLPGADRRFNIPLNAAAPYVTRSWEADVIDEDIRHSGLGGAVSVVKKRKRRTITLKNVILNRANRRLIEELRDLREAICVSPPWVDGTDTLTYLPLQKTLSDSREEKTRSEVDFTRLSARFNSVTGRKTLFGEPHWEDAPRGSGIHVSDVINDHHEPSYELRSYLTTDAEDSGATTLVYVSPAQAVLWDNYGTAVWPAGNKAFLMISNEEETTNTFEIALISAINTTTGLITLTTTDGTAVTAGTSDYTYAKRTYISSNLVSDGEMEDSGVGSWADYLTPQLSGKSKTQNETGTQCLRVIEDAGAFGGVEQEIGDLPADTNIVFMARVKLITGNLAIEVNNDAGNIATETTSARMVWIWMKYCYDVGGVGQETITIRFRETGAAKLEFLIGRVYIFQNCVQGGMEPADGVAYDGEDVVTTSAAATTTYAGLVVSDAAAWNLANARVGMIAKENVTGVYGRINNVNDAGDQVTVDAWVGGAPVNGNACEVRLAVAPGWDNHNMVAGNDILTQDTDEHGGGYAQQAIPAVAGRGVLTAANVFADGYWYLVGGYFKVAAGAVLMEEGVSGTDIVTGIDNTTAASYTFFSAPFQAGGARKLIIKSSGAGATWLTDDVVVIRLPGNPYDDVIYDLSEALSTTGFTLFGMFIADIDSTDYVAQPYWFDIGRRTFAINDRVLIYQSAADRIRLHIAETAAGVFTATVLCAFNAGDSVYWAARFDAGDMKIWQKVNDTATTSGTQVGATVASGITRAWFRAGAGYAQQLRASLSGTLIIQEAMSDANIEAIIDAFSGADADRLALLEETHGILYEIRRGGVRVRGPAKGDEFRADIVLTELDRIGPFATRDSA